jgi:hypothetical protein
LQGWPCNQTETANGKLNADAIEAQACYWAERDGMIVYGTDRLDGGAGLFTKRDLKQPLWVYWATSL